MRYQVSTHQLFTSDGRLIKQLHCPHSMSWSQLETGEDAATRRCGRCQHPVTDTALRTEEELLVLMAQQPHACLKVSLEQDNLIVIR